jgi:fucose permease
MGLALYALVYGMMGPTLTLLGEAFRLDLSEQGTLMTVYALGYLISVLVGGYLADRWGKGKTLTAGLAIMGIGLAGTGLAQAYLAGLTAFAVIGAGGGFVEMTISAIVSERLPERRGAGLNLLQIVFGLSAASPLLLTGVLGSTGSWRPVYIGLGAASLVLTPVSVLLGRGRSGQSDRISLTTLSALYRRPRLWVIAISQGLYAFAEVSLLSWAVTYLVAVRGETLARANTSLSVFWVLFGLGRLGCSVLSTRLSIHRILVALNIGATATLVAAILAPTSEWAWAMVALSGLTFSGVFGTILAYAGDTYPQHPGTVFGLVLATGSAGAVLGPWLIGTIAEAANLSFGLAVVALAMLATGGIYLGLGPSRADRRDDAASEPTERTVLAEGEA